MKLLMRIKGKIFVLLFLLLFLSYGYALDTDNNSDELTPNEQKTYGLLPGEETDYKDSGMLKMRHEVTADQEDDSQALSGESWGDPYDSYGQLKDQRSTQESNTYQPLPGEQTQDFTPEGKLADERSTN